MKKFKPKPTLEYVKPKIDEKSTKHTKWINKNIDKFYFFHMTPEKYRAYKIKYYTILCLLLFLILILVGASLYIYEIDTHKINLFKDWHIYMSAILIFLSFAVLIIILFYAVCNCLFFNRSLQKFKGSSEYKKIVNKFNSIAKIKKWKHAKVKLYYKMSFISKDLFNVYKIQKRHSI